MTKRAVFQPYSTNGVQHKQSLGLGDRIEKIVKPIAVAMKAKCLDEEKKLKAGTPCAKRRDALNKAGQFLGIGKTIQ